jgi:hypothetical protein
MRMSDRTASAPRASTVLMLWALLLYMAGAVLHPFIHLTPAGEGPAAVATAAESADGETPAEPAGEEQQDDCVACKLARVAALPVPAAMTAGEAYGPVAAIAFRHDDNRAPPPAPSAQPRAPPSI